MSVDFNPNANVQNLSTNAADLQGTTPVGNQPNADGSTTLDQQFFSSDNPVQQQRLNPLSVPKPAGNVTRGALEAQTDNTPVTGTTPVPGVPGGQVRVQGTDPFGPGTFNPSSVDFSFKPVPGAEARFGVNSANGGSAFGSASLVNNFGPATGKLTLSGAQPLRNNQPGTIGAAAELKINNTNTTFGAAVNNTPTGTNTRFNIGQEIPLGGGDKLNIGANLGLSSTGQSGYGATVGYVGSSGLNIDANFQRTTAPNGSNTDTFRLTGGVRF
jgi:hypothetical protein